MNLNLCAEILCLLLIVLRAYFVEAPIPRCLWQCLNFYLFYCASVQIFSPGKLKSFHTIYRYCIPSNFRKIRFIFVNQMKVKKTKQKNLCSKRRKIFHILWKKIIENFLVSLFSFNLNNRPDLYNYILFKKTTDCISSLETYFQRKIQDFFSCSILHMTDAVVG